MFRSIVYVVWLYGWMAILGVLALPTLLAPRAAIVWFIRLYTRLIIFGLRIICRVNIVFCGEGHIPDEPVIVAGKHQAMLDVFMPFLLLRNPVIIMKRELVWYPVFGLYALKAGMLPIDRTGTTRTMRKLLKDVRARLQNGATPQFVIYPEGTRKHPGARPDYKTAGVRALYKALNTPVVPLATNSGLCWPARGLIRKPGIVTYEVLAPLPTGQSPKKLSGNLESVLEAASTRLLDEGQAVQKHMEGKPA